MMSAGDLSERHAQALAELDKIVDPCSASLGTPIGLVGMGVVERVEISGGAVSVLILPTFPNCMFRGVFEEAIEQRLSALPWVRTVSVAFCSADRMWDESRLAPEALNALGRARRAGRAQGGTRPLPAG